MMLDHIPSCLCPHDIVLTYHSESVLLCSVGDTDIVMSLLFCVDISFSCRQNVTLLKVACRSTLNSLPSSRLTLFSVR